MGQREFAIMCLVFLACSSFCAYADSKIVGLLDEANVETSTCDFVRFTYLNKRPGKEIETKEGVEAEEEEEGDGAGEEIDISEYDNIARIE